MSLKKTGHAGICRAPPTIGEVKFLPRLLFTYRINYYNEIYFAFIDFILIFLLTVFILKCMFALYIFV